MGDAVIGNFRLPDVDAGEIGKPQQIRERFGAWVEREGVLDDDCEVTAEHRGWRMDSAKAGGAGFPWMFDYCVHFFATAEYLMKNARINEVYSLMSDISWMNKAQEGEIDQEEMNIYKPQGTDDIPIITWTYDDPSCQGVWMRAESLNGKYDPDSRCGSSRLGKPRETRSRSRARPPPSPRRPLLAPP